MNIINVADIIDPDDSQGRTYRQINVAKTHGIPVGALVEISHDSEYPSKMDGVRLFVVMHSRDCDQTPLYELGPDLEDTQPSREGFRNSKWIGGYAEGALKVIRLP